MLASDKILLGIMCMIMILPFICVGKLDEVLLMKLIPVLEGRLSLLLAFVASFYFPSFSLLFSTRGSVLDSFLNPYVFSGQDQGHVPTRHHIQSDMVVEGILMKFIVASQGLLK